MTHRSRSMALGVPGRSPFPGWLVPVTGFLLLVATQGVSAQHVVQGRVVDTTDTGLPGVEVAFPSLSKSVLTDSSGHFRLTNVAGGARRILVRKIGYQPLDVMRTLMADTVTLEVRMAPSDVVLPTIEVTARGMTSVPKKLERWAARREQGRGTFFDGAFLRDNENRALRDILRKVQGIHLVRFDDRAGVAAAAGTSRHRNMSFVPNPRASQGVPLACYMAVYLDGAMIWSPNSLARPPNLDDFALNQMAAIEVFRTAAEIPPEFNAMGSDCGVLSMWTR